jgi:RNA-directed DNA polymerase
MKDITYKWEDIDWAKAENEVFRMQKRIFRKSKDNRRTEIHRLQQLLAESWYARCLAVRRAAEDSRGKGTPGIDGQKNLSDAQKLQLAKRLSIQQRPKPVRRTYIPKPGSSELRPLGIPTIADRALQQLIVFVLEPEWEAHLAPHQYGFRRGRSCHDALIHIRLHIQRSPKWVLDADIEKFFDRLDHSALLEKLGTWPRMRIAISRILRSGALDGNELVPSDQGTPQGGPLSPLLANIALSGLERALGSAIKAGTNVDGHRVSKSPRIVIYADDFVVLHEHRSVVEAAKVFIEGWLRPLGLSLSPSKTRITHTLEKVDGQQAGFDFLGCRVQQFRIGKYSASPFFGGIWTDIRPSKKAVKRLLENCAMIISRMGPHKKRNASYQLRQKKGQDGPIEIMIIRLNRCIRGWSNYHRYHNAKTTFSGIDHKLYHTLWAWAKRTFPRRGHERLVQELWLTQGRPWTFRAPLSSSGEPRELYKAASTPIKRYIPIQADRTFYDGDWAYWGARRGKYPGLPMNIGGMLKRQAGKCAGCKEAIGRYERVTTTQKQQKGRQSTTILLHERCGDKSTDTAQHGMKCH